MTIVFADNLNSHQNDQLSNNHSQETSENENSQLFPSKDEINMISVESNILDQNGKLKNNNEVHFSGNSDCDEDEYHKLQTQHSQMSASHKSFALTHRTSFLSTHKVSHNEDGIDDIDSLPDLMSFSYLDALALMFSVGSYIFDIVTDVTVASLHYLNGNYWYFALTVAFVAFPTFVMTSINLRWYIVDSREPSSPKVSKWRWFFRVLFLLLQFGPIMRYIDAILFGLKFRRFKETHGKKSRVTRKHFQYMIYEDADATMLRLFECFLEAAPQLVLQFYILAVSNRSNDQSDWTVVAQIVSVNASLISLSWSLVSYLRILRMSLPTKENMTWPGTIIQFHWRLFMIASRVVALALFASEFTYYIGIVCVTHWLVMFIWIISMKTNFCNNFLEELFYNAVLAVIFIFCYFNPVDSPTRKRYTFYYTFMFCENFILITLWHNTCDPNKWYRFPGLIGFFVCFSVGLVFMIIYYLKLHPTENIRVFSSSLNANVEQPNEVTQPVYSISNRFECAIQPNGVRSQSANSSPRNANSLKYARQFSDVWTTQNRLLHPRPTLPTI